MCPACLALSGPYVAGGVSAGAATTFLATKLLRKRPEPSASTCPARDPRLRAARADLLPKQRVTGRGEEGAFLPDTPPEVQ
jgi:hypothetical protein